MKKNNLYVLILLAVIFIGAGRCEADTTWTSCLTPYAWNSSTLMCEVTPSCAAGDYAVATNRCEQTGSAYYTCPTSSLTNADLATCNASCTQTVACTTPSAGGSGSGMPSGVAILQVLGNGHYLNLGGCADPDLGGCSTSNSIYFSNVTFSGSIGSLPGSPVLNVWASGGNQICFGTAGRRDGSEGPEYYLLPMGCISVAGGTVSGGSSAFMGLPYQVRGFTASGSSLCYSRFNVDGQICLTITPNQTCPLGSYSCSGGTCTGPQTCTGPSYSCTTGWDLSGSICYQPASCPSGGTLNGALGKCQTPGRPAPGTYYEYDEIGRIKTILRN